jgi:pimeloyl-ACP methyl ester carboxylesterase
MLALYYTYQHKDRVRALILSGVPIGAVIHQMPGPASQYQPHSSIRMDTANGGTRFGPTARKRSFEPRLAQRIKEDCADVAERISMSLRDAPGSLMLASIPVPVLVIHGSNPAQEPGDGGPELARILPNATLITLPNTGHDPWLDQPTAFFDAANDFLAELPSIHRATVPR